MKQWRKRYDQALVIIDQFEELFTLSAPEIQGRFAELLGRLALEADVRLLLSMRDDFLLRCQAYESLRPIFSDLTPLAPPTGDALRRALVQPALICGYRFEDDSLVDDMLREVSAERGALPLLAFAAARLWESRDCERGLLTRRSYMAIGGVAGALAQHAEATLVRLGAGRAPIVQQMFRHLVTAQETRVVVDIEELLSIFDDRNEAEVVLRHLIDARLLKSFEGPAEEEGRGRRRVEIIHESLLWAWPRLVRWRSQDAEGASCAISSDRRAPVGGTRSPRRSAVERQLVQGIRAVARALSRAADGHRGRVRPGDGGAGGRRAEPPAVRSWGDHRLLLLVVGVVAGYGSRPLLKRVAPRRSSSSPWGSSSGRTTRARPWRTPWPAWREPTRPRCGASGLAALSRAPTAFVLKGYVESGGGVVSPSAPMVAGSPKSGSSRVSRWSGCGATTVQWVCSFAASQHSPTFTPDSRGLLTLSDGAAHVYSLPEGKEVRRIEGEFRWAFIRGGSLITGTIIGAYAGCAATPPRAYPLSSGRRVGMGRILSSHTRSVGSSIDPPGRHVIFSQEGDLYEVPISRLETALPRLIVQGKDPILRLLGFIRMGRDSVVWYASGIGRVHSRSSGAVLPGPRLEMPGDRTFYGADGESQRTVAGFGERRQSLSLGPFGTRRC